MTGGYDEGYRACPCFWGKAPGSLVADFLQRVPSLAGWRVLDAGCGEGKNAVALAQRGAHVVAVDVSEAALSNARLAWSNVASIAWMNADIRTLKFDDESFDLVVAYGLLHCLSTVDEAVSLVDLMKRATRPGGFSIVCAFNARHQDLSAHPAFSPLLLPHEHLMAMYSDWDIVYQSDLDLHEIHPHNLIPHVHSMTRIVARKPILAQPQP